MSELGWIEAALSAARPQAVGALMRHFRDLDTAEEAFQEACLRALKNWPKNGPPRDAAAWLIMVGRNAAIDAVRKQSRLTPLPEEDQLSEAMPKPMRRARSMTAIIATMCSGFCLSAATRFAGDAARSRWRLD